MSKSSPHQPAHTESEEVTTALAQAQETIASLTAQVAQARESERRALADYQNMSRRQTEERTRLVKMATAELVTELVQPLDHLRLAAEQVKNPGLDMVVAQLWQTLAGFGIQQFGRVGDPFNPQEMEAVAGGAHGDPEASHGQAASAESDQPTVTPGEEDALVVAKVTQPGYKLNGEVIKVAKVIVSTKKSASSK